MERMICVLALLLGSPLLCTPVLATTSEEGSAYCLRTPGDGCRIGWTWNVAPRQYQWLQQLEPSINAWRNLSTLVVQQRGQNVDAVEDGRLYRVVSCDDEAGQINCIESTVVWALLRPASVQDVPKLIVFPDGAVAQLMKNGVYRDEVALFNLHRLSLHLHDVDWATLPSMMAKPERKPLATVWESIDDEIYLNYNLIRADAIAGGPVENHPPVMSESELNDLRRREIARLDEEDMIIFAPSVWKHTVTVFADISCKHCRQLHRDTTELNAMGIRVRLLAYPQIGPDTNEWRQTEAIWCANDRRAALARAFDNQSVETPGCQTEDVIRQYALAVQLRIVGSPIILNERGETIGGYLPPGQMLARLEALRRKN
jgi:hypothetical protein